MIPFCEQSLTAIGQTEQRSSPLQARRLFSNRFDRWKRCSNAEHSFLLATAICIGMQPTGAAAEVKLTSEDGALEITGEFLSFDGKTYAIRSEIGDLNVRAEGVSCEGPECPQVEKSRQEPERRAVFDPVEPVEPLDPDLIFFGSEIIGEGIMPVLMESYAAHLGAFGNVQIVPETGNIVAEIIGDEGFGDPIGSFVVVPSVSTDAFLNLRNNKARVGMSSRRVERGEAQYLRESGAGRMIDVNNEHFLAVDSLVMIVNPSNPINELSVDQLRGIYDGSITDWEELGGNSGTISVVQRGLGSATRLTFESRVYPNSEASTPTDASVLTSDTDVADFVIRDTSAIGYVSLANVRGTKAATLVGDCGIRSVPDSFSARTDEYLLQRFLYLYSPEESLGTFGEEFIAFATSRAANQAIAKTGFVDLGIAKRPQSSASQRALQLTPDDAPVYEGNFMREMMSTMTEYDRLSSTFRFETASQRLTPRGRLNLEVLVEYLEDQAEGTELLLVGFTDDVGAFESNLSLARGRARQVNNELEALADGRLDSLSIDTVGYGEIAPVSCNTDDNGRAANRRVEAWIKVR